MGVVMGDEVTSERLELLLAAATNDAKNQTSARYAREAAEMRSIVTELLARRHFSTDGGEVKGLERQQIAEMIMLEIQGHDFGHEVPAQFGETETTFRTSGAQIDLLDKCCGAAADRILAALSQPVLGEGEDYVIWSNEHRCWWGPNSCGYAVELRSAGRYSRQEALDIAKGARNGWTDDGNPDEIAVPLRDAEFCLPTAPGATS